MTSRHYDTSKVINSLGRMYIDDASSSHARSIDRSNKINELSSRNENIGMELVFNDNSSGETDNIDMINSSDNTGNDDNIEEVIV
ncbi:7498_t:CDS:2 [Entrophospora sp. SA101]|nr:7498_t:CDS:2 [Entrophospora sp. SA101]